MQHIFSMIMLFSWPLLIVVTWWLTNWALKIGDRKFTEQEGQQPVKEEK